MRGSRNNDDMYDSTHLTVQGRCSTWSIRERKPKIESHTHRARERKNGGQIKDILTYLHVPIRVYFGAFFLANAVTWFEGGCTEEWLPNGTSCKNDAKWLNYVAKTKKQIVHQVRGSEAREHGTIILFFELSSDRDDWVIDELSKLCTIFQRFIWRLIA